jgi:hypothetical protein
MRMNAPHDTSANGIETVLAACTRFGKVKNGETMILAPTR